MSLDPDGSLLGTVPGLPDAHFVHDGLITKRVIRAAALAWLRPLPGQLLWDLGAGAGSVAIEWCRTDPQARAIAVERNPQRVAGIRTNAANLTRPGQLEIIESPIDEALDSLPRPDAIFIGGGAGAAVVDACIGALPTGGRLLVHGVSMETESLMVALHAEHGGELTRVHTETADRIGTLRGWQPARAVVAWYWERLTGQPPAAP